MHIAHVNADKGIAPHRSKGAAVHLCAMREAFNELGHSVSALDQPDASKLLGALEAAHDEAPLGLVYERLALNAYSGTEFSKRHKLPHVIEVNAPLDEEEARYRGNSKAQRDTGQLAASLCSADLLLCVSEACAAWARSKGAQDERVVVAGNGVDVRRFAPARRQEGVLNEYVAPDKFVIGFHGRLRPWHAFGRLVKACKGMLEKGHEVHLVMIGKGDFKEEVQAELPPQSWTHLPWVDHALVGAYVARFDVLPLSYDPAQPCYFSPLKLLEGMAAGAAAVVPDLGDLAESVKAGKAGLIYDAEAPDALQESLTELYLDPARRASLAQAGRQAAEQHSWLSIASEVLRIVGGNKN